jgi:hypothetical protein
VRGAGCVLLEKPTGQTVNSRCPSIRKSTNPIKISCAFRAFRGQKIPLGIMTSLPQNNQASAPHDPDAFLPERYPLLEFPQADWDWFVAACHDIDIEPTIEQRQSLEKLFSHLTGVVKKVFNRSFVYYTG